MKVCNIIELKTPTTPQIMDIVNLMFTNSNNSNNSNNSISYCNDLKSKIVSYTQGDLRKLNNMYHLYKNCPDYFTFDNINNIFQIKSYNDDTKKITNKLINQYYNINDHNNIMNDTDRTSVGLLWHENIIDSIEKVDKRKTIPFYISQLDNICFADYIDRITFQKQIWQFNEMSSLIKTFKNNRLFHNMIMDENLSLIHI